MDPQSLEELAAISALTGHTLGAWEVWAGGDAAGRGGDEGNSDLSPPPGMDAAATLTFQQHLQDFEAVTAQLAYAAPLVPMAADLKQRLFDRLAIEELGDAESGALDLTAPTVSLADYPEFDPGVDPGVDSGVDPGLDSADAQPSPTQTLSAEDLALLTELQECAKTVAWTPYTPVAGVMFGQLSLDVERREIQAFVRSWGGATFPRHRHAGVEEIVVLEGDLLLDDRVYGPGDRIISTPGTHHQPKTLTGCLLYLKASLDDETMS